MTESEMALVFASYGLIALGSILQCFAQQERLQRKGGPRYKLTTILTDAGGQMSVLLGVLLLGSTIREYTLTEFAWRLVLALAVHFGTAIAFVILYEGLRRPRR